MINTAITPDSTGDLMYGNFGYYSVGDKIFYNNADAYAESKQSGHSVKWDFYGEHFQTAHSQGLWRNLSLTQLYAQRARQLRQKYDHVTVLFSGGWDSRNILNAFEKEGLHIDAIAIYVIPELDNATVYNDKEPGNWYGEIKYHALPYAREYCKRHPGTKLLEIPWVETTIEKYTKASDEELYVNSRLKPGFWFGRHITLSRWPELIKDIGYKSSCIIQGLDKPCIIHHDMSRAQGFFPEGTLRLFAYPRKSLGYHENQTWEFFYWTPDLPELAIRGWYELLRLCKRDALVNRAHNSSTSLRDRFSLKMSTACQESIKDTLYEYFDPTAWQARKQVEWGFHMTVETPVINILNERGIRWQAKLTEQLKQLTNIVGEENLVVGDKKEGAAAWLDDVASDGNMVLDYKAVHGKFIDLDISFVD